jgi:outer membrane receptor for ferrienterochelin and colicin
MFLMHVRPLLFVSLALLPMDSASGQTEAAKAGGEEIVVTAAQRTVILGDGKTTYTMGDNPQASSGSAADALGTLPTVSVDAAGGVRVRGETAEILINGKSSPALRGASLATALQSIPAATILKIEVITSPGPEYRSNASSIINIITKKATGTAANGEVVANIGAPNSRQNVTLIGSLSTGKWTFAGNASMRHDLRHDILDVVLLSRDQSGADVGRRSERRTTFVPYTNATASVSADYAISSKFSATVSVEGALRYRPRTYVADNTVANLVDGTTALSVTTDSAGQNFNYYAFSGTLTGKKILGNDKLSGFVSIERHQTDRNSTDITQFVAPPLAGERLYQSRSERDNIDQVRLDYQIAPTRRGSLKLGTELENEVDRTGYLTLQTGSIQSAAGQSSVRLKMQAAYLEYSQPFGNWTFKGGLRYESLRREIKTDASAPPLFINDSHWNPSFSLSGDLSANSTIALLYSRRIERPTSDQLTPIRTTVNSVTETGNPNLQSEKIDKFSIEYKTSLGKANLSTTAYYSYHKDSIIELYSLSPVGQSTLEYTYINSGRDINSGVEASLNLPLSKNWEINLDLNGFHDDNKTALVSARYPDSIFSYSAKFDLTWKPTKADSVGIQSQFYGKTLLPGGQKLGYNIASASYRHVFSPRLKANIVVNNIFDSTRYIELTDIAPFAKRSEVFSPGITIFAGLTYKFGESSTSN